MLNPIIYILTILLFSISAHGQENDFFNFSKVNGASEISRSTYMVSDKFGNEVHKFYGTEISTFFKDGRISSHVIKDEKGIEKATKKYKYDIDGRLNEITEYHKGVLIGKIIYSYPENNILQSIEYGENGDPIDRVIYEKDLMNRVTKVTSEGYPNEVIYNYSEFGDGNIIKESIIGGEISETRTYQGGNLVLFVENNSPDRYQTHYTHDSFGNVKSVRKYLIYNENNKNLASETESNIDVYYKYDTHGNYTQATVTANTIGIVKTIRIIKRQIKYY